MAHASSVVSARAMAPGTITPHKNTSQLDDYCSALVADYCSAVDRLCCTNRQAGGMPLLPDRPIPRPL